MKSLLRLLPMEMDDLIAGLGAPRYRADQLLRALWKEGRPSLDHATTLPATLRQQLADADWTVDPAAEVQRQVSVDGDTTKLLLRMDDGTLIETVLMQYRDDGERRPRSTVCVSTQAGCAMACIFCATGQMGFQRNLAAEEIVAQVLVMQRALAERGEHVTNVVFMGMGEPLANYPETIRAVRLLTDPRAFGLGQRSITISTVGVLRAIERLSEEGLQVGLAISLHAPNEALRQRLVPTAGPQSVANLIAAARRYQRKTGRRVTFEYALIDGANDSPVLAAELGRRLQGMGAHVNLIPVNPTAGGFGKPPRNRVLEFEQVLRDAGITTTVRVEKGSEISAACGQLRTDVEAGMAVPIIAARGRAPRKAAAAQEQSQDP